MIRFTSVPIISLTALILVGSMGLPCFAISGERAAPGGYEKVLRLLYSMRLDDAARAASDWEASAAVSGDGSAAASASNLASHSSRAARAMALGREALNAIRAASGATGNDAGPKREAAESLGSRAVRILEGEARVMARILPEGRAGISPSASLTSLSKVIRGQMAAAGLNLDQGPAAIAAFPDSSATPAETPLQDPNAPAAVQGSESTAAMMPSTVPMVEPPPKAEPPAMTPAVTHDGASGVAGTPSDGSSAATSAAASPESAGAAKSPEEPPGAVAPADESAIAEGAPSTEPLQAEPEPETVADSSSAGDAAPSETESAPFSTAESEAEPARPAVEQEIPSGEPRKWAFPEPVRKPRFVEPEPAKVRIAGMIASWKEKYRKCLFRNLLSDAEWITANGGGVRLGPMADSILEQTKRVRDTWERAVKRENFGLIRAALADYEKALSIDPLHPVFSAKVQELKKKLNIQ